MELFLKKVYQEFRPHYTEHVAHHLARPGIFYAAGEFDFDDVQLIQPKDYLILLVADNNNVRQGVVSILFFVQALPSFERVKRDV